MTVDELPQIRRGENATLVPHSVKGDTRSWAMRRYEVLGPVEVPEFSVALIVRFKEPRGRIWRKYYAIPCGYHYITIERNGDVVIDSRDDVPCDMAQFEALHELMDATGYLSSSYNQPDYKMRRGLEQAAKLFDVASKPTERTKRPPVQGRASATGGATIIDFASRKVLSSTDDDKSTA